jgi:rubrerythrin
VEVRELREHIRALASLEESGSPVISCYLDTGRGTAGYRSALDQRVQLLRKSLAGWALADFEQGLAGIERFLSEQLDQGTRGAAVFARAGTRPFFLGLQFHVQVPTWIAVGTSPNIYHLVELKDNYDRYVILLATESGARIVGVNLGSITEQIWRARPELRRRVGREWSKDHFQDHRRQRTQQFIHEEIHMLERLISTDGYEHLVIAGNPRITADIRRSLPKRLAARLVDVVPASAGDRISDVVALTLRAFLEHEELESQAIAEKLTEQIHRHGLAVAGTEPAFDALKAGQADYLVLLKGYAPDPGWECRICRCAETESAPPARCPVCRTASVREFDVKAELVRLAERSDCGVEIVERCDALLGLGGVGCLLRYLAPESYVPTPARERV